MSIKYNRLLSVSLEHGFYKNGVDSSLSLHPDERTRQLLTNGKLLFKKLGSAMIVLFKASNDQVSPFIDLGKDVRFRFYLTTSRSDAFFNSTHLDTTRKYSAGNKLHFQNDPANASDDPSNPELLAYTLIDSVHSKLFTYSFVLSTTHTKTKFSLTDSAGNPVSVGKDTDGNELPTVLNLNRDDTKTFHQQVDLRSKPSGIYSITITNDSQSTILREETVLIDDQALQHGVLGLVDINYNSATDHMYGDTEFYKIGFTRKQAFWKYFIVNKNNNVNLSDASTHLTIQDSPSGGGPPYTNVNFLREGDEPHATTKIKGFDTVIFKSDAEIPSYEDPKLNLQLLLSPEDKIIVEHLANPPVNSVEKENGGDVEKEIFVFI